MRRLARLALLLALLSGSAGAGESRVTAEDVKLLGLLFNNRYKPLRDAGLASPELRALHEEFGRRMRIGEPPAPRYRALIEGFARIELGRWDEDLRAAAALDLRLGAKIAEPGGEVRVRLEPLFSSGPANGAAFTAKLEAVHESGAVLGSVRIGPFPADAPAGEAAIRLAPDAPEGRAEVRIALHSGEAPESFLTGRRTFFVIGRFAERLRALEERRLRPARPSAGSIAPFGPSRVLARTTLDWFADLYAAASRGEPEGIQTGHPFLMEAILAAKGRPAERLDYLRELARAEDLAAAAAAEGDPLAGQTGDLRFVFRLAGGEMVPFRLFVPETPAPPEGRPLVIALHGAGGDENAFMDRYGGTFKANAARRGWLAAAPFGLDRFGGYRGAAAAMPGELASVIAAVWPVHSKRVYLMGHSMGGMGAFNIAFENPGRFAAAAALAGYGAETQMAKAPRLPLFLAQGTADPLTPVSWAREVHAAALKLGLPVRYLELEGARHVDLPERVMGEVFLWFDEHSKDGEGEPDP